MRPGIGQTEVKLLRQLCQCPQIIQVQAHKFRETRVLPALFLDPSDRSKGRNGWMRIWLDRKFVDRLLALRGPGESYSDVILRVAKAS